MSVGFSPDGQRIVSSSDDGTIRVWSATTGETEAGPFIGHTSLVRSVGFSPDGQRIVSGSSDRTIRVWSATTGETEADPFTGHTDSVTSVRFSPDGQRIVSGSSDRTIRVWSATTGETEAGPFIGHTDSVRSVGFSPDGQHIVSGSDDGTIRVWNATTGETEAGPFAGHTHSVMSVGFSPDGQRIVSGSSDRTIRVWSATTGETEAGPFAGHTHWIGSVGFSPDGQRIVSSGGDTSIRMLNLTTGKREATGPVDFTDYSAINDEGWICGSGGELLMWIPPVHRAGLHRPSNIWVASEYETRIDLSTFVHGHSWATCIALLLFDRMVGNLYFSFTPRGSSFLSVLKRTRKIVNKIVKPHPSFEFPRSTCPQRAPAIHSIKNLPQLSNTGWDASYVLTVGRDNPDANYNLPSVLSPCNQHIPDRIRRHQGTTRLPGRTSVLRRTKGTIHSPSLNRDGNPTDFLTPSLAEYRPLIATVAHSEPYQSRHSPLTPIPEQADSPDLAGKILLSCDSTNSLALSSANSAIHFVDEASGAVISRVQRASGSRISAEQFVLEPSSLRSSMSLHIGSPPSLCRH
ncbi:WD40-repeat-containing domain protein [Lactarius indigo]|nr:WD40-repeat-containing domain protein [Lactarius indigo]